MFTTFTSAHQIKTSKTIGTEQHTNGDWDRQPCCHFDKNHPLIDMSDTSDIHQGLQMIFPILS